jgi:pilus assembly protein CpaB
MRRPVIFVLLAGFAALVAAIVVYSALKKREAALEAAKVESINVVVAAHDLSIGSKIDAGAVKTVRWSKDDQPPGAFNDPGPVINQFTKTGIVQNEPIVADRLFSGDKNAGVLPLLIPTGMRAVSVPVDEVSDIAGFVQPHAHVDILVSMASSASGNQPFSKTVLQNVEVLAVAQEVENPNADKAEVVRVVTLLVTPDEAERVVLASHEGALRLTMRNYEDKRVVATNGVSITELLRGDAAPPPLPQQHLAALPPPPPPQPKPVEVEVMRNGKNIEALSFVHRHAGGATSAPAAQPDSVPPMDAGGSAGLIANPGAPLNASATEAAVSDSGGPGNSRSKTIDIP